MKTKLIIVFFGSILINIACKKSNRFDCVKRSGPISNEIRSLARFNVLEVFNNAQVFLVQDTNDFIEIKAGKNLISNVETQIVNQKLTIKNNNKCNFTRSYKHAIEIYVHFVKLDELIYKGTGPITSMNPIVNDVFTFNSWDGTDSVKLNLEVPLVYANIHTGVADLIVTGNCEQLFAYGRSNGVFRMQNFKCQNVYANNISSGDYFFWVENKLEALVQYLGNTYYKGSPKVIIEDISNKGKLIQLD